MENETIKPDQAAIVFDKDNSVHVLIPKDETLSDSTIIAAAVANAITENDKRIQSIVDDFINRIETKETE